MGMIMAIIKTKGIYNRKNSFDSPWLPHYKP